MSEFQVIILEGLFYFKSFDLYVENEKGNHLSVQDSLKPLLGQRVKLSLHQVPPSGIRSDEPGSGSCRFPGGVGCPVEHNLFPKHLLSCHLEGVLQSKPFWAVREDGGAVVDVPFRSMDRHYGRLAVVNICDLSGMAEAMRRISTSMRNLGSLRGLLETESHD